MQDVENVDLTTLIVDLGTVQIYTSTVQDLIDNACIEFHIEDLLKAGQRQWKAVMQYVGMHLFPDTKVLKDKSLSPLGNATIPTNCNRYDREVLYKLCDYYIYISNVYSKLVSTVAFSYFVIYLLQHLTFGKTRNQVRWLLRFGKNYNDLARIASLIERMTPTVQWVLCSWATTNLA